MCHMKRQKLEATGAMGGERTGVGHQRRLHVRKEGMLVHASEKDHFPASKRGTCHVPAILPNFHEIRADCRVFLNHLLGNLRFAPWDSRGFRHFYGCRDLQQPSTQPLFCSCLHGSCRFRDSRRFCESGRVANHRFKKSPRLLAEPKRHPQRVYKRVPS